MLNASPADLGLSPTPELPHVFGALMETGYSTGVATLIVLADGTASLYLGHGGGFIGAGEHASVRSAGAVYLQAAEEFRSHLTPTDRLPLPKVGRVRFYMRTFSGTLTAEARERGLGDGRQALSPLFFAAHGVITAIRKITEAEAEAPKVDTDLKSFS